MWRRTRYLLLSYKYSLNLCVCFQREIKILHFLFHCNKLCDFPACTKHLLILTVMTLFWQLWVNSEGGTCKLSNSVCHFLRFSHVKPEYTFKALHRFWGDWGVTREKPQNPVCRLPENTLEYIHHQPSPFSGGLAMRWTARLNGFIAESDKRYMRSVAQMEMERRAQGTQAGTGRVQVGLGSLNLKWTDFLLYTNAAIFLCIFGLCTSDLWVISVQTQVFCMWGVFLLKDFKVEYTMLI